MRVLVTSAGGYLGKQVISNIIKEPEKYEFLLAIDANEIEPLFNNDNQKEWYSENLSALTPDKWIKIIQDYDIDTIFYLECIENRNQYFPSGVAVTDIKTRDEIFTKFLKTTEENSSLQKKLNVVFLSTSYIHRGDEFPNELNSITLQQPEGNPEIFFDEAHLYAVSKLNSEFTLLSLKETFFNIRIIRPFNIIHEEIDEHHPVIVLFQEAFLNKDLVLYWDGTNGFSFTHIKDLADFITDSEMFSENNNLLSRVINFCRSQNYLPEEILANKIKSITNSESKIVLNGDQNKFQNILRTPQIRNMAKIWMPRIPIEVILENIGRSMSDIEYTNITILSQAFLAGDILEIVGEAEPESSLVFMFSTGDYYTIDVDEEGRFVFVSNEVRYEGEFEVIIKGYKDGRHYDTAYVVTQKSSA